MPIDLADHMESIEAFTYAVTRQSAFAFACYWQIVWLKTLLSFFSVKYPISMFYLI